jgi:pimeloyl-ACP methyl ester carboxylesterase
MRKALAPIEDEFELIYFDYPGCGKSVVPDRLVSAHEVVEATSATLLEIAKGDPIDVLCHSFGTYVLGAALGFSTELSVRSCVAVCPSPYTRRAFDQAQQALIGRLSTADLQLARELLQGNLTHATDFMERLLTYYCSSAANMRAIDLELDPVTYLSVMNTIGNFDLSDQMNLIGHIEYVFGSDDFTTPSFFAPYIRAKVDSVRLLKGGHFIFIDSPVEFCEAVRLGL